MTLQQERQKARLAAVLLLTTIIAILLQAVGLRKTFVLDHQTSYVFNAIDDRANGGETTSSISIVEDKFLLECDIVKATYQWPYCEISFNLADEENRGVDFSKYEYIKLWLRYVTPTDTGIRVQLRNYDDLYSTAGDDTTYKYNLIEFYERNTPYPIIVPLKSMHVPTWWLVSQELPLDKIGTEFHDVRSLEIATGSAIESGHYKIEIERIEVVGKYMSDRVLYLVLLCIWGLAAFVYLIFKAGYIKSELKLSERRQKELEALNRLLNVKSRKLEEKLSRDPLTGVLNRDGIAELFNGTDYSQKVPKLSIMFIDIDHFKKINDNYGHNFGDAVLVKFAQVLSENTRENDILARWGGEEFVLACPNTELSFASQLAEKLRKCIENYGWPHALPLTASFGVAQMQKESPTDFIERADKALYTAKAQGRNRVVVAGWSQL
ncbi:putative diguanylate cyclase YdaM [Thalassocella blandensis]|nr:putative diguanylate cyclase YdaM [Thalassocella blandensis]